jgi:hypothetical protein
MDPIDLNIQYKIHNHIKKLDGSGGYLENSWSLWVYDDKKLRITSKLLKYLYT